MLKVKNLVKEFDSLIAVDDLTLEVKRGEIFGLLGPNGAGKTTTIRTILNIIKPDQGEITFNGHKFTEAVWNLIGYLPEERGLYRKSTVLSTILYFASLKGMQSHVAKPLIHYWLERFDLKNQAYRKIEELSKGNQQKVQIIISIIHNPQLLILDEPFAGLDPVNQVMLKDVLLELRQKNTAIIFSTHQMEQVERLCDNISLINKGKQILNGQLREIKKQYGKNTVHLIFDGDGSFLKELDIVSHGNIYQNYAEIELVDISKSQELLDSLKGRLTLRMFEIIEPSLNSIFITAVGGIEQIEKAVANRLPEANRKNLTTLVKEDNRVRKALFQFILIFSFTIIYFLVFSQDAIEIIQLSVMLLINMLAGFRYFYVKRKVKGEYMDQEITGELR